SPTLMFRRLPSLTNATAATQIYALSLHDALPIYLANTDMLAVRYAAPEEATTLTSGVMYVRSDMARGEVFDGGVGATGSYSVDADRKSTRLNSSHVKISYAVFCLKKKKIVLAILL